MAPVSTTGPQATSLKTRLRIRFFASGHLPKKDVRGSVRRRDTIMLPVEMLRDFIDALHRIEDADASAGSPRSQSADDDRYEDDGHQPAAAPQGDSDGDGQAPARHD